MPRSMAPPVLVSSTIVRRETFREKAIAPSRSRTRDGRGVSVSSVPGGREGVGADSSEEGLHESPPLAVLKPPRTTASHLARSMRESRRRASMSVI